MDTHNAIVVKAADIEHVLREKLAFLPGSRDRDGRSLLLFRPKDAVSNPDHLRILLHYLHSIAKNGDAGYTVVLDMRGKVKWDSVKPLVKALNNAVERGVMSVPLVLIIRPDKFLEKQKAQFAHGISRAEVQTVTVESLSRYFDVSQLPRDFGGHFAFDYDDWLDTRLALEGWIWRVSEWMRSLEECRRRMHEEGVPVCVQTAETAIAVHTQTQKRILAVPMDQLEREEMQMEEKIRAGQQRNGDLDAAIPHMRSVISSLLQLKNDVFARWQRRREELREAHQSKLLERDVEGVLVWIKCKGDEVLREMENVGDTLQDTEEKIKELHEVEETLKNMDLSVGHVQSTAARTRSTGRHVLKVGEEHSRLIDLLNKRRHLLTTAAAFERAEKKYTEEWSGCRGTRVRDLPSRDSHVVKEALLHNEELWKQADSAYLNALEKGNKLSHAWNAAECTAGERKTKERVARLSTAHRIVNEEFKEAKKELSMMNAFDAFEEDLRRVFTWLDDHGEPYLKKNRSIGDNRGEAVHLRNNHIQFREIARGTSENAKKLFEVGEECLKSGLFEEDLIRSCLTQLHARISSFESAVEGRLKVLNQATLFFTHHEELLTWYDEMERKYSVLLVHSSVSQCEHDNRQWTLESDGTGQAYTTTVGEGTQLVHAMQEEAARHGSALRTSYVERLHLMLGEIDERNAHLNALWNRQRPALQWALKFAVTLNDIQDLVEQMASWQDDMHTLVQSDAFFDSAEKVIPFHADNQVKVRRAVEEIKTRVNELRQLAGHHGLESLCTVEGEPVDEVLNERIVQLHAMEDAVAKSAVETAKRLEAAKKALAFHSYCNEFMAACEACEKRVHSLSSAHPTNLNDALRMVYDITECQKEFEARERDRATSYRFKFDEVLRNPAIPRNKVVDWNHEVNRSLQRLNLLFSERLRAVKAGADFYKTYNTVSPILDHLTRDYSSSSTSHDWCATCQGTPEKKLESMTEQLKAHVGVRDKFQTGCTYTQKTSDLFLKYLNRCPSSSQQRECVHHVQKLRAAVRQQQAHILELWARKKKELDRCHQWVLFECSRVDITGWLKKEAAESLRAIASATGTHRNELLNALTVKMKERRSEIRTLLNTGECMMGEGERHAEDIRKTMQMVTDAFEEMAGKLNKETDKKEELSLDRRSDQTVEGKMPQTPKETTKPSEPMKELLNTERVYIDDLRKCIDVYLNAFDRFEAEDKIPPPLKGRRSEIFGNIEDIFTFHADTFVGELEKYEKEPELVGMSFTVYVGALSDLYTSYCAHKDLNKNLLHQGEAVSFFESIREAHHLETKDSMDSLLIKPVQRVTRYALLMGQLCKNNDSIKEALEVVSNIPKKANDICHLNYIDSKDKEKIMHAGALVTQDALNVWEPKLIKGKGKERQVFLFESALVFTKKVMEAGNRTRYLLKGKPIQMGDITSIAEHLEGDKCRLALRLGDLAASENNRIELRAASESAKVAFVKQLRNCMHEEQLVSLRLRLDTSGLERNGLDYDEGSSLASHDTNRNSIQSSSSTDIGIDKIHLGSGPANAIV